MKKGLVFTLVCVAVTVIALVGFDVLTISNVLAAPKPGG
jgi:hypothetical protein